MKRTLAIALAVAAVSTTAFAQRAVIDQAAPVVKVPANAPLQLPANVAEEREFVWFTKILQRRGPSFDTNRSDLTVPLLFDGGTEMRGFGQIFPAPKYLYPLYTPSVFNENGTAVFDNLDTSFENDQEYIDQFKGAGKYSISFIRLPLFRNPRNNPQNPGLLVVYKTKTNFNANTYKSQGFASARTALTKVAEYEINTDGLDSTVFEQDGDTLISFTRFVLDGEPGEPNAPLEFADNESMMLLYVNEFAPAVQQPIGAEDTREWQRVIAVEEYGTGSIEVDPDNPNQVIDTRGNPLDSSRCFGLVMFRTTTGGNTVDQVFSAWRALVFRNSQGEERRALVNLDAAFVGTLELASGVDYHFGVKADNQGIGAVTPNPVRDRATIPFQLTNRSQVKIDLFNSAGDHVKSLVDGHYVEGKYSYGFSTEDLSNGVYMVRMITGDQVYTSKITVTK